MSECPSDDDLRRMAGEDFPAARFAEIESHISGCPSCQARLEAIAWDLDDGGPRIPGFEIEKELGRGTMGVVYLARREGLDLRVAVKVQKAAASPAARRRWLAEARAASRVKHPNVVPLYDYGQADGRLYLVLEYVPGGTLKDRMAAPLAIREAAALVRDVARGVDHVHACGLLHLDLKPSNILIDRTPGLGETPRVSDFGLARPGEDPAASLSRHEGPWGTPSYMAPEQLNGTSGLGPAADVHAIGAILYQALAGRAPFRAASILEMFELIRDREPDSPRAANPRVGRDLETIVLKCLEKDPRRRYASAGAVADDLGRWLDGRPILARPVPALGKAWRFVRRNPGLSASIAAAILVLAVGFARIVAAKREAERGLALATAGLVQLSDLILDDLYNNSPLEGEGRARAIRNLEDKLGALRGLRGSDPGLLSRMMQIQSQIAGRSVEQSRFDEARKAAGEALKFAGELRRQASLAGLDYWLTADTHRIAGYVEVETGRPTAAAAYADEATSMTLAGPDEASRRWLVYPLLDQHRAIAAAASQGGDEALAAHHRASRDALVALLEEDESGRSDRMLGRAAALAASGRLEESVRLAEQAFSQSPPPEATPGDLKRDVRGWLMQYRFAALRSSKPTGEDGVRTLCDNLTGIFDRVFERGLTGSESAWKSEDLAWTWLEQLTCIAIAARQEGRVDQSEAVVDLTSTFGDRLAAFYPHSSVGRGFRGQAHIQRSKNAWRRDDLAAVRHHLEAAVGELQQNLSLDDDAYWIHGCLRTIRERLAALPAP